MDRPALQPGSLSRPLGLLQALSQPGQRLDFAPLFDVLLITLLLLMLSSRFLFPPGVALDLPRASDSLLAGSPTASVLTVESNDMILFNGRHYTLGTLERDLLSAAATGPFHGSEPVLLVKVGREVNLQTLLKLAQIARKAGYLQVQIAAGPEYGASLFPHPATGTGR